MLCSCTGYIEVSGLFIGDHTCIYCATTLYQEMDALILIMNQNS
jgi:hypothetical protein